jgi:large subunit ribosomal protein L19
MNKFDDFKNGDKVKVSQKIKEGKKERVINFEGIVLKMRGKDENCMFTIRQVLDGVMVDRIIPLMQPSIQSIKVIEKSSKHRGTLPSLRKFTVV